MNPSQTAIMSLEESRPRGTVLDKRADRRRVCEVEFFSMQGVQRLDRCAGLRMDRGPRRPAAAPSARSGSVGCTVDQRGTVVRSNFTGAISPCLIAVTSRDCACEIRRSTSGWSRRFICDAVPKVPEDAITIIGEVVAIAQKHLLRFEWCQIITRLRAIDCGAE